MSGSNITLEQARDTAEALGLPEGLRTWGELANAYEHEVISLLDRPKREALEQSQNHVAQLGAEVNRLRAIITELTAERLAQQTNRKV